MEQQQRPIRGVGGNLALFDLPLKKYLNNLIIELISPIEDLADIPNPFFLFLYMFY